MKELSGDGSLSKRDRVFYLVYNLTRGIAGYACRMRSKHWHSNELEEGIGSPSRKYLYRFLLQELPKIIPVGEIDVLDVGCGSAFFRNILADLGYKGRYTGIDVHKHKNFNMHETPPFKSIFMRSKIEDFETDKKFDIVLSITALEHVEDDALAVSKCDGFLKQGGRQVHIVPSFWSLFLYMWHGYRQYNPKRIKSLFNQKRYRVYRLGGMFSFCLHLFFITIPALLYRTDRQKQKLRSLSLYPRLLRMCNRLDGILPVCSCLYVVVVKKD